jgi:small subunit ribosomal protein S6e
MKQGILINGRVKILMKGRVTLYRPRRTGERKRKSCRGCICGSDLSVIALRVLEKGDGEVEGLTDAERPRRLGPKRANAIRKSFVLRKTDDVRKYVVRRLVQLRDKKGDPYVTKEKDGKTFYKSAKVQRLITEKRVRRKVLNKRSRVDAWKTTKEAHVAYEKLLSKYLKEKKAAKKAAEPTPEPVKAAPAKAAPAKKEAAPAKKAAPAKAAPAKKEAAPAKTEKKSKGMK